MSLYHTFCGNKVIPKIYEREIEYECNKCKNGMWSCGKDCSEIRIDKRLYYICNHCELFKIEPSHVCSKKELKFRIWWRRG